MEQIMAGSISQIIHVKIMNTANSSGAGLTGLLFDTTDLVCYFFRNGDTAATTINLVTATLGTWTSGGFKEVDDTKMPGVYELGLPDAALAIGSTKVMIQLQGAVDMAQTTKGIYLPVADFNFLGKVTKYKKTLEKIGNTWYEIVYEKDPSTTKILQKAVKDLNGDDISDFQAGKLVQELESSV